MTAPFIAAEDLLLDRTVEGRVLFGEVVLVVLPRPDTDDSERG